MNVERLTINRQRLTSMVVRLAELPFDGFDRRPWFHGRDSDGQSYSFDLDGGRWIRWGEPPVVRELSELRLTVRPGFLGECESVGFVLTSDSGGPHDNWPAERHGIRYWLHPRLRGITQLRPLSFWSIDDFRTQADLTPAPISQPRVIQFGVTNRIDHSGATTQRSLMELI